MILDGCKQRVYPMFKERHIITHILYHPPALWLRPLQASKLVKHKTSALNHGSDDPFLMPNCIVSPGERPGSELGVYGGIKSGGPESFQGPSPKGPMVLTIVLQALAV